MELGAFQAIARSLKEHRVDYLVVGGMAVVAHGYGRMTFNIDLVARLEQGNILRTFHALQCLGYQPQIPVTAEQFADALVETFPDGLPVRFVDLARLIEMKKTAGRGKDVDDIQNLELLRDEP